MDLLKLKNERSEEVSDIIDRMPTKFGIYVSAVVIGLIVLMFIFGFIVRYPESISGSIVINTKFQPIKLVANSSGKILLLNFKTKDEVKSGDYLGIIQNAAIPDDLLYLKGLIDTVNPARGDVFQIYPALRKNVSLGDLNERYYQFLNALEKVYDYHSGSLYQKQKAGLIDENVHLNRSLENDYRLKSNRGTNLALFKKMFVRDSMLFVGKAITEAELDNTKASFLSSKESYQAISGDINTVKQHISDNLNKLAQIGIQNNNDESQMKLDLLSTFDALKASLANWEEHYVLKSPIKGKVQFLKFWTNNQFVQSGEDVFAVVPTENSIIGQMNLPANGAGKVHVGQKVIIKLEDYPFQEYGSIAGYVKSVSLTTNTLRLKNEQNINAYLIDVVLPDGLKTNYNTELQYKSEMNGVAEIVCKNQNIIQRCLNNLKYAINDK